MYCGHEYALQNLQFAAHVDPENDELKARIDWARSQRAKEEPTVPSTIGRWQRRLVDVFLIDMTYGKLGSGWERVLYFTT